MPQQSPVVLRLPPSLRKLWNAAVAAKENPQTGGYWLIREREKLDARDILLLLSCYAEHADPMGRKAFLSAPEMADLLASQNPSPNSQQIKVPQA